MKIPASLSAAVFFIDALFAKWTYLGCTPRWLATEDKFKCPYHGSGFYKSAMNFEGPAPRPLDRF
jgi:cytochrome b6-f complex iron-sulfur subunit